MVSTHSQRLRGSLLLWLSLLVGLLGVTTIGWAQEILVSPGAVWKYLDDGSDQATAWVEAGFDDSDWGSGAAQLGYGENDQATVVSFGGDANNKFITTYFRHAFNVVDASAYTNLMVELLRDDGAIVYLNGLEVFRSNMPGGAVSFTTLATASVGGGAESTFFAMALSSSSLVSGMNLLAVEVHQRGGNSSDLSFDLELLANIPNDPPTVSITSPSNNSALSLGAETVIEVDASDSDGMVESVVVYEGSNPIGEVLQSPYTVNWAPLSLGAFALTAVATDSSGVATTSTVVNVTVLANLPPTVSLVRPANGARVSLGVDVELEADAADSDGMVQSVEFLMDGTSLGVVATSPFSLTAENLPEGTVSFVAVASDDDGASTTSAVVNVTVEAGLLVGFGALWKYLDDGSDQGTNWIDPVFDDTAWAEGAGELGYGDGDETTVVSFGGAGNNKHTTTYFRHRFAVPDLGSVTNLELMLIRDDGAVVYLNGLEVFRDNMPATFDFETFSSMGVRNEAVPVRAVLGIGNVVEGVNVLAVEVHQQSLGSSDLSLDLSLTANTSNAPPIVTIDMPSEGTMVSVHSNLLVSAQASDPDGNISRVEFFVDGGLVGGVGVAPYSLLLSNLLEGNRELTALAYDHAGGRALSAPLQFHVVGNLPPTVTVLEPADGLEFRVGTDVQVRAEANDADGVVTKVEFYDGTQKLGEANSPPYDFLWLNVPLGIRELAVVAIDDTMGRGTTAVTLDMVSNRTPEVSIASPADGAFLLDGTILEVEIDASDPDGVVDRVELYLGAVKVAELAVAPYLVSLPDLGPGAYTFRARVFDGDGAVKTSRPVSVELSSLRPVVLEGATWSYLDTGEDQGVAWREPGFDDGSWAVGAAEFGYGDDDEVTVIGFGGVETNKFPTTYFRHSFVVADAASFTSLQLGLLRDDGAVVYLNGVEVFRENMPAGEVLYGTFATASVQNETEFITAMIDPALLVDGVNVLAVEIHQSSVTSSDASFNLRLRGADEVFVSRGPYLQNTTPSSVTVRWRTAGLSDTRLVYGAAPDQLDQVAVGGTVLTNEHIVRVEGLDAGATYYYAVGGETGIFGQSPDYFFTTFPEPGTSAASRIWVLGDSGKGGANARAVRDAFYNYNGIEPVDLVMMLGDNAYENGTDQEFQERLFEMFSTTLRNAPLYPVLGNHDTANSTDPPLTIPYFESLTLPEAGEAGGVPSGTEKYYSFDYGNIHFVCLDIQTSDRSVNGPMLTWLREDLELNNKHWLFVTAGNPPYGAIGNNSDVKVQNVEVRENILPILEEHGLDLFMAGDDHAYERSFLLNGHYGLSNSLTSTMILNGDSGNPDETGPYNKLVLGPLPHRGAVYVVSGASSQLDAGNNTHPAMYITRQVLGSLILDVSDTAVDVRYLTADGVVEDYFRIIKPKRYNFAPVVTDEARSTFEGRSLTFGLSGTDWNGDELRFRILTFPETGEFRIGGEGGELVGPETWLSQAQAREVVYVPHPDANGIISFEYVANDGLRDSLPGLYQIRIFARNDPPVALAGEDQELECVGPLTSVTLDGGQSFDVDGDTLTYTWRQGGVEVGTGAVVDLGLGVGQHVIELTVQDPRRANDTDEVIVTIFDTTGPIVNCPAGAVVEYVDRTGALVSYGAGTADDLCDGLLPVVCLPPSGGVFGIGISEVVCSAADSSGNLGGCSFTVEVRGPWGVHKGVFEELVVSYLAAARGEDQAHVADVISEIVETLVPEFWVDELHLSPTDGEKVFTEDAHVLEELQDILDDSGSELSAAAVQGMIDRLLSADRLLAAVAIEEADLAGASSEKLEGDREELVKGDRDRDAGNYKKAVEHYGRAWSRSVRLKIRLDEETLRLEFAAGGGGGGYVIETSTNLIHWERLGDAVQAGEGLMYFEVPRNGGGGSRFYRVVAP